MLNIDGARVLVTGGAGFIGSELVRQLVASGAEVVVADSLRNGKRENLDEVLGERCRLEVVDIRHEDAIARLLPGTDVIYHLACLGVRHSIHAPLENHEVNATASLMLLERARAARVPRFVYVSTSEVYGTARTVPMREDHPTIPMTVYGASKLAAEGYARALHRTHGYATVVVRPFNAYGPRSHHEGDSGEVIPRFMLRCLLGHPLVVFGDGEQTRDFSWVGDTAKGIMAAGVAEDVVGETLNLGTGEEVSINDLAREVAETAGRPQTEIRHDSPRPGDVLRLCADASRSRQLLGFKPSVSLREGLSRLRDWFLSRDVDLETLLAQEVVRSWEVNGVGS